MFSKDGHGQTSGAGMMFAAMLKPLGLNPEVIEALSRGLLTDLKAIVANTNRLVGLQEETIARLEFVMRYTPALEGDTENKDCWEAYLAYRRSEHLALEAQANDRRNGNLNGTDPGPSAGTGSAAG